MARPSHARTTPPATPPPAPAREPSRPRAARSQELPVHQVELELQNEELRRTQLELAAARDRFVDLYDFAPVGYFTLDGEGVVVEANLTGAALLGEERQALLGHRFARFIAAQSSDRWQRHLLQALQHDDSPRIELALHRRAGAPFHGQLDCLRVAPVGAAPVLRITLADITQRKQAEMDRRIADSATEAREAERRRIARELHEELGQRLSALKMGLASLRPPADPTPQDDHIAAMLETIDEAVATVRRIAAELRPLMLDDLGLNAAIDWLARDTARRTGLAISRRLDEDDPPLGERASIALYRMVEEALAHIVHPPQATDVRIEMGQRNGELVLTVEDNGAGWPAPSGPDAGDGPDATMALRERAHLLGGRLELDDARGGGRRITVRLPLRRAAGASPTHDTGEPT